MKRTISIEIDCKKKFCGKCKSKFTDYFSATWCGIFGFMIHDGKRVLECIYAEKITLGEMLDKSNKAIKKKLGGEWWKNVQSAVFLQMSYIWQIGNYGYALLVEMNMIDQKRSVSNA